MKNLEKGANIIIEVRNGVGNQVRGGNSGQFIEAWEGSQEEHFYEEENESNEEGEEEEYVEEAELIEEDNYYQEQESFSPGEFFQLMTFFQEQSNQRNRQIQEEYTKLFEETIRLTRKLEEKNNKK